MSGQALLDYDPVAKSATRWHEEGDDVIIENVQDVQTLVDQNKALYAQSHASDPYGEFDRVASLPLTVYWDLQERGILDDEEAFRKWLNDPANRHFRTRPGKI